MTWHIGGGQLDAYLAGHVDATSAASVEAHLVACAECRSQLARRTPATSLASSWQGVARRIDAEPTGRTARVLTRAGVDERHVRLLAPTVPLRLAWLGAILAAACSASLLVRDAPAGGSIGALAYLTVAAIVPLAAVAASLSAASEPAPEVAVAAPLAAARITGLRAGVVLVVTVLLTLGAGVFVPGPWTEAALWLLPSLAMCALTTALSGRVGPGRAAAAVGLVWLGGVGIWGAVTDDRLAPFRTGPQLLYLALAVLAGVVLVRRPELMDPATAMSAAPPSRRTP